MANFEGLADFGAGTAGNVLHLTAGCLNNATLLRLNNAPPNARTVDHRCFNAFYTSARFVVYAKGSVT